MDNIEIAFQLADSQDIDIDEIMNDINQLSINLLDERLGEEGDYWGDVIYLTNKLDVYFIENGDQIPDNINYAKALERIILSDRWDYFPKNLEKMKNLKFIEIDEDSGGFISDSVLNKIKNIFPNIKIVK